VFYGKNFDSFATLDYVDPWCRSWTSLGSRGGPVEDDLILSVGTRGRGKGEFANPQGVAVTSTGRILVSDSNNQCVQVGLISTHSYTGEMCRDLKHFEAY
jgi:hypothetical protein